MISYAFDPTRGSEPGVGWNWALAMARRGHDVHVVHGPDEHPDVGAEFPPSQVLSGQLTFEAVNTAPPRPSLGALDFYRTYRRWLDGVSGHLGGLDPNNFDIAHHVTLTTPYWGSSLKGWPGRRVLGPVGISGSLPSWALPDVGTHRGLETLRSLALGIPSPFTRMSDAIRSADLVFASDTRTMGRSARLGKLVQPMIPDGVRAKQVAPIPVGTPDRRAMTLVWAGRLLPRKGVALAVEAFSLARHRMPGEAKLLLIGGGPELDRAQKVAAETGAARQVEFAGPMSREHVVQAFATGRAHVFSSLRDTLGGVLLESASRATPAVTFLHEGLAGVRQWYPREAMWGREVRSRVDAVAGLAEAMVAALTAEDDDWTLRSVAAQAFALENTWEEKALVMERAYESLVRDMPRSS